MTKPCIGRKPKILMDAPVALGVKMQFRESWPHVALEPALHWIGLGRCRPPPNRVARVQDFPQLGDCSKWFSANLLVIGLSRRNLSLCCIIYRLTPHQL